MQNLNSSTPAPQINILVVDDEPMILNLTRSMLEIVGYSVTTVDNGVDAISIVKNNKTGFGAVILDASMPRFTGLDTLKGLISVNPNVKVIVTSGCVEDFSDEFLQAGAKSTLQKPYNLNKLIETIKLAMEGCEPSDQ